MLQVPKVQQISQFLHLQGNDLVILGVIEVCGWALGELLYSLSDLFPQDRLEVGVLDDEVLDEFVYLLLLDLLVHVGLDEFLEQKRGLELLSFVEGLEDLLEPFLVESEDVGCELGAHFVPSDYFIDVLD